MRFIQLPGPGCDRGSLAEIFSLGCVVARQSGLFLEMALTGPVHVFVEIKGRPGSPVERAEGWPRGGRQAGGRGPEYSQRFRGRRVCRVCRESWD